MRAREWVTRNRGTILVLGLITAFLVSRAVWLLHYRAGQPLDIDEAGYLAMGMTDFNGLTSDGIVGLLRTANNLGFQAPLTSVLAALLFVVTGPKPMVGLLVPLGLGAVTMIATWLWACKVTNRRTALVTVGLVCATPLFYDYSASFNFAMTATCAFTLAMLAYTYSHRFHSLPWSLAFGVFLGLVALARTMAIAFIPGLVLAAAIQVVASRRDRVRGLVHGTVALAVALLVAASWYWTNWRGVLDYLTSFGYGNRSLEYGPKQTPLSPEMWLGLARYTVDSVYLPIAILLLVTAVISVAAVIALVRKRGFRRAFIRVLASRLFPSALVVLFGMVALASSSNRGSGFLLPLIPPIMLLAGWALMRVSGDRVLLPAIVVGMIMLLAIVPKLDLTSPIARPVHIDLPVLGITTVTNGQGAIQLYEQQTGFSSNEPALPVRLPEGKQWVAANNKGIAIARLLASNSGVLAFGFRNSLYNTNTFWLGQLDLGGPIVPLDGIAPLVTPDTLEGYRAWLTNNNSCVLLTSPGTQGEFNPYVNQELLTAAAKELGFKPDRVQKLPGGRTVTFWRRAATCPAPLPTVGKGN